MPNNSGDIIIPTNAGEVDLSLHAKVYFDNGIGGEIYFDIIYQDIEGPVIVTNNEGFLTSKGLYYDEQTPLGGYLHIASMLYDNTCKGMEKAVLYMSTDISYWGSRPKGWKTVDWKAEITNCDCHITNVTN